MSAGFWDWATAAYAAPGVSDACLAAQDEAGQNVPLLLWAAWCARTGRALDDETLEAACDATRAWETTVVAPLRVVRREMKTSIPDMGDLARELVRDRVKAVELEAERHLMAALEHLAAPESPMTSPPIDALAEVARAWSRRVPRPALTALADRLPS